MRSRTKRGQGSRPQGEGGAEKHGHGRGMRGTDANDASGGMRCAQEEHVLFCAGCRRVKNSRAWPARRRRGSVASHFGVRVDSSCSTHAGWW